MNHTQDTIEAALIDACPALLERLEHPVYFRIRELRDILMSLNDNYRWSREDIADWLESLDLDLSFS